MRILIEAHHPSDIHFWKYVVRELAARGHETLVLGRERDVMKQLLAAYDWIPHKIISSMSDKNTLPIAEMLWRQFRVAKEILSFKPDLVASVMGSYTQSAKFLGKRNLIFTDSEHQSFNHRIAHPFADKIYTPDCFWKDLGRKQVRYTGNHELCFLNPKYFKPDTSVCELLGTEPRQYIILRLCAWNTLHDLGQSGLGNDILQFVEKWKDHYDIIVVAEEGRCPPELKKYIPPIPPERFHDALACARLVISEGASTASESACLGTPTVYINSTPLLGYLKELEKDYNLVHCFSSAQPAIAKAHTLLESDSTKSTSDASAARKRLYDDQIDLPAYIVAQLESYAK